MTSSTVSLHKDAAATLTLTLNPTLNPKSYPALWHLYEDGAALAQELGLPENPNAPMLGFIGRLDYQKGVDLIRDNFQWIMDEGCQLILLGSGRADLENNLRCAPGPEHSPLLA